MAQTEEQPGIEAAAEPSRTNWAGNFLYNAQHFVEPGSLEDLQRLLPTLGRAKAVGSRHSFNHIADTEDTQLALPQRGSMSLDPERRTVTIGGGVRYGELAPYLHERGFALRNLASLPHISVAGACATGTHGSGIGNQCLSAAVVGLELVTASGETLTLSRETEPELFRLAVVGLGAFGIITHLTLEVVPTFDVAQCVYENLSFDQLEHNRRAIFGAGYSVSLFTDWQGHRATQVWVKRKLVPEQATDFPDTFFGATMQTAKLHPLPNMHAFAENCTDQQGVPGPWYERLPHFRLDYTPSAGAELQTEYFVPFDQAYEALLAIEPLRDRITPLLLVSEMRAIAADDLPMSMCFKRESLAFHFTWKQELEAVRELLPLIEAALAPFAARPHWAKLFTVSPAHVRTLYPGFSAFEQAVHRLDPTGKFRNAYLSELLES